jgi:hypothetical protein
VTASDRQGVTDSPPGERATLADGVPKRGLLVTTSNQQTVTESGHAGRSVRTRRRNPFASGVFREMALVTIGMCALSVFMTWPALRDPAHTYMTTYLHRTVTGDSTTGDPMILVWAIAWAGHGLAHMPGHVFDGNVFYPAPLSLAFSDSMLGYGPVKLLGGGPGCVLVDYNLLFVAAPALTGVGGYALARQLGASPLGAAVAGLGLAFAPWRAAQFAHLHVLSTGQFTAALAMLARGHGLTFRGRKGPWRPLWVALGWAFAAWQVSIGFAVGLPFTYLLAVIALATLARGLARRMPRPPSPLVAAELAGGALFGAVTAFMGAPYLDVARTQSVAVAQTRSLAEVQLFSPTWRQLLEPPDLSGTWSLLAGQRSYSGSLERLVLPGYVLIALAVVGLFYSAWRVRWRVALAAGIAVVTALTLGTHLAGHGEAGFVFLWRHAPGWASDRTPGRLIMFVTLGLALLAAGAVTRLAGRLALHRPRSRAGAPRLAVAAVLPVIVLVEGLVHIPVKTVPPLPAAMAHAPGPLIVLPSTSPLDPAVMVWSAMTGFPETGNGASGISPSSLNQMRRAMLHFPDATSVTYLRSHHFRSVVVLKGQAAIPASERIDPGRLPAPSLGLRRIDMGDSVLYLVEPRLPGQPLNPPGGARGRVMVQ